MSMTCDETVKMPEGFDYAANVAAFQAGKPYICWFCAELRIPGGTPHSCVQGTNLATTNNPETESMLADPYSSRLVEFVYKLSFKNPDFRLRKLVEDCKVDDPLMAAILIVTSGEGSLEELQALLEHDLPIRSGMLTDEFKTQLINIFQENHQDVAAASTAILGALTL